MKKTKQAVLVVLCLWMGWAPPVSGETEWHVRETYRSEGVPLDTAVAPNGRRVFVLTDRGELRIYSAAGELQDTIPVGRDIGGITAGTGDDDLFLVNRREKSVQRITLSMFHAINVANSPFKGPQDAAVTIVVFDDFQ